MQHDFVLYVQRSVTCNTYDGTVTSSIYGVPRKNARATVQQQRRTRGHELWVANVTRGVRAPGATAIRSAERPSKGNAKSDCAHLRDQVCCCLASPDLALFLSQSTRCQEPQQLNTDQLPLDTLPLSLAARRLPQNLLLFKHRFSLCHVAVTFAVSGTVSVTYHARIARTALSAPLDTNYGTAFALQTLVHSFDDANLSHAPPLALDLQDHQQALLPPYTSSLCLQPSISSHPSPKLCAGHHFASRKGGGEVHFLILLLVCQFCWIGESGSCGRPSSYNYRMPHVLVGSVATKSVRTCNIWNLHYPQPS